MIDSRHNVTFAEPESKSEDYGSPVLKDARKADAFLPYICPSEVLHTGAQLSSAGPSHTSM
jgi:hypothetical protein